MTDENQNDTRQIAGDIVSSYLSNNQMPPEQVPEFIRSVIAALQNEEHAPAAEEPQKPAVSIKRSVSQDAVVCLECGAKQKTLKRHIRVAHGLEESDYRGKWGLSKDHPLVAPDYSKARSAMAQRIGLGRAEGKRPTQKK